MLIQAIVAGKTSLSHSNNTVLKSQWLQTTNVSFFLLWQVQYGKLCLSVTQGPRRIWAPSELLASRIVLEGMGKLQSQAPAITNKCLDPDGMCITFIYFALSNTNYTITSNFNRVRRTLPLYSEVEQNRILATMSNEHHHDFFFSVLRENSMQHRKIWF